MADRDRLLDAEHFILSDASIGLTARQIADRTGLHPATIGRFRRELHGPAWSRTR